MPIIELDPSLFDPIDRLTLAHIEAWMLDPLPEDAERREAGLRTATLTWARERLQRGQQVPATVLDAGWELAMTATPLPDLQREANTPFLHGVVVGDLLRTLVGLAAVGETVRLADVKRTLAEVFRADRISVSTIENTALPRFRSVAHLFAAFLDIALAASERGERTPPFPCSVAGLPQFLALSEFYRRRGEELQLKRRSEPFLAPGQAITFAVPFELPDFTPSFERRTPSQKTD